MKLTDRTTGDAGAVDIKQDKRQTLVPLAFGVSTENAKAPIGKRRAATPCFLTRDDVMVAVRISASNGLGSDCRHVTACTRFGPCLSPYHFAFGHWC